MYGDWKITFPKHSFKLFASSKKLTMDGYAVVIMESDKWQFPSSSGWVSFEYESWLFYVRWTQGALEMYMFSTDGSCKKVLVGLTGFCAAGKGTKIEGSSF